MGKCVLCNKQVEKGKGPFFQPPKNEEMCALWSRVCDRAFKNRDVVCADHFLPTDYVVGAKRSTLLPRAVPIQLLNKEDGTSFDNITSQPILSDEIFKMPMVLQQECEDNSQGWDLILKDCETQTDFIMIETTISMENEDLKKQIKRLMAENKILEKALDEANAIANSVKKIYTEGQIRKLIDPNRKVNWDWKDISSAICLHASGPRAYHHMYENGFPLPHVSTLQRWYRKIDVREGMLKSSVEAMQQMGELSWQHKMCILSFDEMKVSEAYEYDQVADMVRKPANYVQVVMARGLLKSWKQPVFFDFDCQMTKATLTSIIMTLCGAEFPVVAVVCDMGPTNRKLWREMNVNEDTPWFSNPFDENLNIFVFADAPHLLKLIRNHFLDSGMLWEGAILTTRTICDVLNLTSKSDASIVYKLTDEHLSVKGAGRQKVRLAAELFSNTTANAIRRCYSQGFDLYKPTETADFVQLVNDWFDVLNSSIATFGYPGKEPFGTALPNQLNILDKMNKFMMSPIIPNKKTLEPFQKGVLMTNRALVMLYKYLNAELKVEYILTRRLNQDILENFFGVMRGAGGPNDHPTPMDFIYRLRKYILARRTEHTRGRGNVAVDSTQWLNFDNKVVPTTSSCLNSTINCNEQIPEGFFEVDMEREVVTALSTPHSDLSDTCTILQEDALEYISGYLIKKLNLEQYESSESSFTWVDQISKGFLHKPSSEFLNKVKSLEKIFHNLNAMETAHCRNLQQQLLARSVEVELPENVKRFFYKCRIHFRVRNLNKRLKIRKAKQRIMGYKKFIKINL